MKQIANHLDNDLTDAFNRDERFVARFFGVDLETVRGWRKRGVGPRYIRPGGRLVKYSLTSLRDWADRQPGGGQAA